MKSIYDVDGDAELRNYEMAKAHGYVSQRYRKAPNKIIEQIISLKEAFLGTNRNISFSRRTSCRHC